MAVDIEEQLSSSVMTGMTWELRHLSSDILYY